MTEAQTPYRETPGSQTWRAAIIKDLRAGYGVEDIAIRQRCDVSLVRAFVSDLRAKGVLPALYEQARREWRAAA